MRDVMNVGGADDDEDAMVPTMVYERNELKSDG
jgi:hypothetical protein